MSAVFNTAFTNQPTLTATANAQGLWVAGSGTTGASGVTTIAGAFALTLDGMATLDGVANAGILLDGGGNNSLSITTTPVVLTSSTSFLVNNAGTLTLGAGGLTIGAGNTLTLGGSGSGKIVISGVIANTTGALAVNTTNAVTLSGANLFSGGVTLTSGTLNINNAKALGDAAGTFVINGGSIDNTSSGNITVANNNVQVWNGDYTYTGSIGRSLNMGTGAVSLGTAAGTSRTINVTAGTLTEGGVISDGTTANSIIKQGAGTLTLSGTNQFTGSVAVNGGTLNLNANNAYTGTTSVLSGVLGVGTASALGTGTTSVLLGDTSGTNSGTISLAVNFARNIIVQAGNSGTMTITQSVSSTTTTMTGTITLGQGTTGHGITLANGGYDALQVSAKITDPVVGGTSTPGVVTINGNINGQTMLLNSGNNYAGGTQLIGGYLELGGGSGSFLGSGTFVINGGGIVEGVSGSSTLSGNTNMVWDSDFSLIENGSYSRGTVNLGAGAVSLGDGNQAAGATRTVTVAASVLTVGGAIGNSASGSTVNSLAKTGIGNLVLGGASTYTGSTTISQGVVQLSTGNDRLPTSTVVTVNGTNTAGATPGVLDLNGRSQTVTGISGGAGTAAQGMIVNSSGTASTLTVANTGSSQFDGLLVDGVNSGSNTLALANSSGTLILTGSNRYSGGTTINGGTLIANGGVSTITAPTGVTASGAQFSYQLKVTDATGLAIGQKVAGTNIPTGTYITAISGTTVTISSYLSSNPVASGTALTFGSSSGSALGTGNVAVNAGTLVVNGTATPSAVTVGSGATLAGTGIINSSTTNTVNGAVQVNPDSTTTTGSLTLTSTGTTTFNSTASLSFNLSAITAHQGNELTVGNTNVLFSGSGMTLTLNLIGSDTTTIASDTDYILVAGTGTNQYSGLSFDGNNHITNFNLTLTGTGVGGVPNSTFYANSYLFLSGSDIEVQVMTAAVPEPGAWILMLSGLALLITFQRMRRNRPN